MQLKKYVAKAKLKCILSKQRLTQLLIQCRDQPDCVTLPSVINTILSVLEVVSSEKFSSPQYLPSNVCPS